MNTLEQLRRVLLEEKIVSPNDDINISLSIGDVNRKKSRLSRRYIVSKKSGPLLIARFIPGNWPFSSDDIAKTYSLYSSLGFFKVPRLIGRISTPDGMFFLEEYISSTVSLGALIESKSIATGEAIDVMKNVFAGIWGAAEQPSEQFIRDEKKAYREYLSAFVQKGVFGDVILDYVDRVIDQYSGTLKQAWSTGDIIDRNILRSGKEWYLVDFEYSHKTLFLFKDAFRNIHYFEWAKGYSLKDIFPDIGVFPDDIARLLSLSWDQYLQQQIVERRAHLPNLESLRRTFWSVLDSTLPSRIDKKTGGLQELADKQGAQLAQLQNDKESLQRLFKDKGEKLTQVQKDFLDQQQLSESQKNQILQLHNIVRSLEQTSKEKTGLIDQLQNSTRLLEKSVAETKQEVVTSQAELVKVKEGLALSQNEVARSKTELTQTRDELAKLNNELARLKGSLAKSMNDLAKSANELAGTRATLGQRDQTIAQKNQEVVNLQTDIRRTKSIITQLAAQVQNREQLMAEKERHIARIQYEIDAMRHAQSIVESSFGFKLLKAYWKVKDTLLSVVLRSAVEGVANSQGTQPSDQSGISHSSTPIVLPPSVEELAAAIALTTSATADPSPVQTAQPPSALSEHSLYRDMYTESMQAALNKRDDEFIPLSDEKISFRNAQVKFIAFYLPQFHPIPENDEWWGRGFTEWRNVSKAVPQFEGHYQPHLPGELGFYDLRVPEVQRRQVELAKMYGVHGFCFHYYWFNGRRLLERPLNQFIADPEIDFPFCVCWANENWTRRWDGMESDILMAQVHTEETDIAFIKDMLPLFRHRNYIRVNGRPLLVIYRVGLMPNAAATAKRWREYCKAAGIGDLYLVAAQSFGFVNPTEVGFDAAVEFPPHNVAFEELTKKVKLLNPEFSGRISSYPDMVAKMQEYNKGKPFTVFKTVSPGWDNEARKPGKGHVYAYSSPELYRTWLDGSSRFVMDNPSPDERLVFINAWNEWAEGAHLEPDQRYGYAYLETTKQVLKKYNRRRLKVSVVLPNYNREDYIRRRVDSIIHQTRKPDEIIFLDDASTDNSPAIAETMLKASPIPYRIIRNEKNSASVFRQWLKGIGEAQGDLIWMCESDDDADNDFLKNILPQFDREDVLLAYGDISYVNPDGSPNNGLADYYHGLSKDRWNSTHIRTAHDVFDGDFAVKNIVPNASGAVFRKPFFSDDEVKRLLTYKFAGDWYFYALIARGGSVGFCKEAKSYFRIHQTSNSRKAFFTPQHIEEHRMVLEDLRALYGISDETVARHAAELKRILSLPGVAEQRKGNMDVAATVQPKNRKEKLKICVASYGFIMGGGEVVPIVLANALRNLGHHVTFMVMNSGTGEDSSPLRCRLRPDIPLVKWEECSSSFGNLVKEFGFDVINSHNVDVEYKLFNKHITPGIPYVASLHGGYETVPKLLTSEFISFLSGTVDAWLYLSEKNYAPLIRNGLKDGRFVKVFNALALPGNNGQVPGVRQILRLPKTSIILVLASRAIHDKGWGIAIDAARKLRKESGKDIHLALIGDGEDLQSIKESATGVSFVHFLGRVENAGTMIHDCDFGIFPSTFVGESFPIFLLECFASGLPVIATDVGAIPDMMKSEKGEIAGALISAKQDKQKMADEIAAVIGKLLRNPNGLNHARQLARKRAEYYSVNKLVHTYLEIFESVIKRKKG